MNMRPSWTMAAVPILLVSCAEAPGAEVCTRRQELRSHQGIQINGAQINGRLINGITLNGMNLGNGVTLQGRYLNAMGFNGTLQGTELHALVDDVAIEGQDWVGVTLRATTADGATVALTIAAIERDPVDPELVYFTLNGPDGQNVCGGEGRGLFVAGLWDDSGAHHDAADRVTFSCTDGVIAKCVRWGYKPWRVGGELHQACTRMARADYCGDGVPHTLDGTSIDVFDPLGIQVQTTSAVEGFAFEAGWGPDGAVCVAHPRYRDVDADGRPFLPSCWRALPACGTLAEAQARGALVANASIETERLICGR